MALEETELLLMCAEPDLWLYALQAFVPNLAGTLKVNFSLVSFFCAEVGAAEALRVALGWCQMSSLQNFNFASSPTHVM